MRCVNMSLFLHLVFISVALTSFGIDAQSETLTAQEQRIGIIIRDYTFMLTQPAPVRLHTATAIILRNQDIVRHGFTAPMMAGLLLHGEGEELQPTEREWKASTWTRARPW